MTKKKMTGWVITMTMAMTLTAGGQGLDPTNAPAPTMYTLNEIYAKIVEVSKLMAGGTATADDILFGRTAWVDGEEVIGAMPNRGALGFVPAATNVPIPFGYYDGTGVVETDADLVAGNIRSGVNIFGVGGQASVVDTESGDAVAGEIVAGKKAWVDGVEVTGDMPNQAARGFLPGASEVSIPAGFYNGSGVVTGSVALVTGNIRSGVTIFGVAGKTTVVDTVTGNVVASNILSGRVAWANAAQRNGTMTDRAARGFMPGVSAVTIPAGYYNGSGVVTGAPNLVAANIRSGSTIFGVAGSYVAATNDAHPPKQTGQTSVYRTGDDGTYRIGASAVPSPSPRFTDNGNGTVTDNLTGLMWMRDPHGIFGNTARKDWSNAVVFCEGLTYATYSDWRLPNLLEFLNLVDFGVNTTLMLPSGHPFLDIQSLNGYWTSTINPQSPDEAYDIDLSYSTVQGSLRSYSRWTWPVRGTP